MPRKAVAPTEPRVRKAEDLGHLHRLLIKACPPHVLNPDPREDQPKYLPSPTGWKSIAILAWLLGIRPWAIFKWIKKGEIPPKRASAIVDLAEGRVTLADFGPFIYT
jgi:hypothetical protein